MSKINKQIKVMANLSAQILRNLVSSVFNVKATEVHLSGELPKSFHLISCGSSGCMYTCDKYHNVYAFHPATGFKPVKGEASASSQNANGTWNKEVETLFEDCAQQAPEAIFFVVHEHDYYSAEGSEGRDDDTWTLYKAPDFQEYFRKVEESDLQRWNEWLNA